MHDIRDRKKIEAERVVLLDQLERLAWVDELTGLMNRRGFLQEARKLFSYRYRCDIAACIATIDLDRFIAYQRQLRLRHGRRRAAPNRRNFPGPRARGRYARANRRRGIRRTLPQRRAGGCAPYPRSPPAARRQPAGFTQPRRITHCDRGDRIGGYCHARWRHPHRGKPASRRRRALRGKELRAQPGLRFVPAPRLYRLAAARTTRRLAARRRSVKVEAPW